LLRERGYHVKLCKPGSQKILECDYLLLDSKVFKNSWASGAMKTLEQISELKKQTQNVLWFNTGDSTSEIQRQVMPYVSLYFKSQLLRDRDQYKQGFYGGRIFTHFYHQHAGAQDEQEMFSEKLSDAEIAKLRISWNFGLAECFSFYSSLCRRWCPWWIARSTYPTDLRASIRESLGNRLIDLNIRMTTNYSRETVAYQRKRVAKILDSYQAPLNRVGARRYFQELWESKLVVSPFGWGEINIRDFETILAGAVLIKPSMDHLETYPNVFSGGETYASFSWDLSDLDRVIDELLHDPNKRAEMVGNAFDTYHRFLCDKGRRKFVDRFVGLLTEVG
jgi:hypothetical protein